MPLATVKLHVAAAVSFHPKCFFLPLKKNQCWNHCDVQKNTFNLTCVNSRWHVVHHTTKQSLIPVPMPSVQIQILWTAPQVFYCSTLNSIKTRGVNKLTFFLQYIIFQHCCHFSINWGQIHTDTSRAWKAAAGCIGLCCFISWWDWNTIQEGLYSCGSRDDLEATGRKKIQLECTRERAWRANATLELAK